MTDTQNRKGPSDAPHIDEATISDETSIGNSTPTALLISGFGSYHTDKAGQMPYKLISLADVRALVDAPQQVDKAQAQWVIPSSLESRVHAEQAKDGKFWMLWADVDWRAASPKPMSAVASYVAALIEGADYEVYASRGATDSRQKCRILIPLNEPLSGRDWIDCQRELNALLAESGIEPDAASERPGQLCFLPNRGAWYGSISRRDGVFFDPMTTWAALIADRRRMEAEQAEAVRLEREKAKQRRESLRASQVGNGAQSLIEAFNQSFHVAEILVQAGYAQRGQTFRHPNSETGSFSASVKDGRVHTLSTSDPLWSNGEGAHDAFSAFCALFHLGDMPRALRDAGDKWITIGSETWNQVARRKYAEDRRAERDANPGEDEPQCRPEFAYDLNGIPYVEFGIDGFTSVGLTAIASEAGTGKTSAVVPLAATVAHLIGDPEDPFTLAPTLRRKVVYVTEDAGQIHRLLVGLRNHRSQASNDEFREWFHIVEARRKSPTELANDIRGWREKYSYEAGPALNNFVIEPLIVIDTSNANIDLDNENDNAEVGRAIAAIKQALEGKGMAWIVAHTAKGIRRDDIASMSLRGASAWVGDVNATVYLIQDESLDGKRFLVLGKRRFEPEFCEIEVSSEVHSYIAITPWGQRQNLRYMVCDLKGLADRDRMAVQLAKARAEKYAADIIELLTSEYESAITNGGTWHGLTRNRIEQGVTGTAANLRVALDEMAKAKTIHTRKDGGHRNSPTYYWLPGQNCGETSSKENRRTADEPPQKGEQVDEPLGGVKGEFSSSSAYRITTNDEAPVPSGAQGAAFEFPKTDEVPDELPTNPTNLCHEGERTPPPMAKNSPSQGASAGSWGEIQ